MVPYPIVLVVENEPLIRIVAAMALGDAGFRVMEAPDAAAAAAILEICATSIHAVVAGIQMSGRMNGLDLARHAHGRWPWIRVLIVSARAEPPAGHMPPGSRFLAKPYGLPSMVAAVRKLNAD